MKQIPPRVQRPVHAAPWRLVLATAALALAGAAMQPAFAQSVEVDGSAHAQPVRGHENGGRDMRGHGIGRMLDTVNATDAQRSQIKQILQAARTDLKPVHEAGRQLHQQTQALFAMPAVDANAAESLRQQGLVLHDQATKRRLQARLDMAAVLTPEQRQLLADKAAARMAKRAAWRAARMQGQPAASARK